MKDYTALLDKLQSMYFDSDEPCDRCALMQATQAIYDLIEGNNQT